VKINVKDIKETYICLPGKHGEEKWQDPKHDK
jgi:hypothetical protein